MQYFINFGWLTSVIFALSILEAHAAERLWRVKGIADFTQCQRRTKFARIEIAHQPFSTVFGLRAMVWLTETTTDKDGRFEVTIRSKLQPNRIFADTANKAQVAIPGKHIHDCTGFLSKVSFTEVNVVTMKKLPLQSFLRRTKRGIIQTVRKEVREERIASQHFEPEPKERIKGVSSYY